jgi:hypothetical protein
MQSISTKPVFARKSMEQHFLFAIIKEGTTEKVYQLKSPILEN